MKEKPLVRWIVTRTVQERSEVFARTAAEAKNKAINPFQVKILRESAKKVAP